MTQTLRKDCKGMQTVCIWAQDLFCFPSLSFFCLLSLSWPSIVNPSGEHDTHAWQGKHLVKKCPPLLMTQTTVVASQVPVSFLEGRTSVSFFATVFLFLLVLTLDQSFLYKTKRILRHHHLHQIEEKVEEVVLHPLLSSVDHHHHCWKK